MQETELSLGREQDIVDVELTYDYSLARSNFSDNFYPALEDVATFEQDGSLHHNVICAADEAFETLYRMVPHRWDNCMLDGLFSVAYLVAHGVPMAVAGNIDYSIDGTPILSPMTEDTQQLTNLFMCMGLYSEFSSQDSALRKNKVLKHWVIENAPSLVVHFPSIFSKRQVNTRWPGLYTTAQLIHDLHADAIGRHQAYTDWTNQHEVTVRCLPAGADFSPT